MYPGLYAGNDWGAYVKKLRDILDPLFLSQLLFDLLHILLAQILISPDPGFVLRHFVFAKL